MQPKWTLAACLAAVLSFTSPASAATLGKLSMCLGKDHYAHMGLNDAPDAASGWMGVPSKASVTIAWKDHATVERALLEIKVDKGKPTSAHVELPDEPDGRMASNMHDDFKLTLEKVVADGPWLHVAGHIDGHIFPLDAKGKILRVNGKHFCMTFSAWVPKIEQPTPEKDQKQASLSN